MFSLFFFFCFFLFLYEFFDCKCKSLKRLGENIKQTNRETETQQNNSKKNRKTQKYRISSPRTSANNLCDLFAEVRGLDILYLCFFSF